MRDVRCRSRRRLANSSRSTHNMPLEPTRRGPFARPAPYPRSVAFVTERGAAQRQRWVESTEHDTTTFRGSTRGRTTGRAVAHRAARQSSIGVRATLGFRRDAAVAHHGAAEVTIRNDAEWTNPRAIAVTATFGCLPRAVSRRTVCTGALAPSSRCPAAASAGDRSAAGCARTPSPDGDTPTRLR